MTPFCRSPFCMTPAEGAQRQAPPAGKAAAALLLLQRKFNLKPELQHWLRYVLVVRSHQKTQRENTR